MDVNRPWNQHAFQTHMKVYKNWLYKVGQKPASNTRKSILCRSCWLIKEHDNKKFVATINELPHHLEMEKFVSTSWVENVRYLFSQPPLQLGMACDLVPANEMWYFPPWLKGKGVQERHDLLLRKGVGNTWWWLGRQLIVPTTWILITQLNNNSIKGKLIDWFQLRT